MHYLEYFRPFEIRKFLFLVIAIRRSLYLTSWINKLIFSDFSQIEYLEWHKNLSRNSFKEFISDLYIVDKLKKQYVSETLYEHRCNLHGNLLFYGPKKIPGKAVIYANMDRAIKENILKTSPWSTVLKQNNFSSSTCI